MASARRLIHARHALKPQKLAIYNKGGRAEHRGIPKETTGMKRRHLLQAASAALALPGISFAEAYPTKPIRYIVPVAAGGGNDMIARVVSERWGKLLGQSFVVENQGG